jgi:hypothetical protein
VKVGVAGMASVGLPTLLRAKSESRAAGKDTSVILIWLDGGPSHLDLYDLKPEAPAEYRGLWRPIPTNVPGIEISELFPRQARVADKFSIVRSLHHDNGDHFIGLRPGYFGANYLGIEHNPFETEGDPNQPGFQVQNIKATGGMTIERLGDRRGLLGHFDRLRRDADASGSLEAMDRFQLKAYDLVTGRAARKAFDIDSEDPRLRDQYGRHSWGQSTLLARRLVEAGCTFVTVHYGGWDHHWNLQSGMERYLPMVDSAVAGLFDDLSNRGLLDRVLVVLCGEFSRTPRMNDGGNGGPPGSMGTPGRDHWGNAMFCLLGGGGVRGGQIVGSTTRLGESPHDRPISPCDIHATIYHVLGVDPATNFLNHAGRPIPALDHGEVIAELV